MPRAGTGGLSSARDLADTGTAPAACPRPADRRHRRVRPTPAAASQGRVRPRARRLGGDPDGGHGEIHDLLVAAVAEAARLLDADGAMVYLVDPATGHLRFAHDAGIRSRRSRAWVRSIDLPVGVGIFGRSVAERAVVVTSDYLTDASSTTRPRRIAWSPTSASARWSRRPLVAGDTVFGAWAPSRSHADAFSPAQIGLVRALADHAAAAMHNVGLIEALDASRTELAKRADVERSLREIGARISAAADFPAVVQLAVDEAARLLDAEGARIELIDGETGVLLGAYASGALDSSLGIEIDLDAHQGNHYGVAGQAVLTGRPYWTGDYINDTRFRRLAERRQSPRLDRDPVRLGRTAHRRERSVRRADRVFTIRPDAWGAADGRPARGHRRPGRHHHPDDPPDRGARPLARAPSAGAPRRSRRCARSPRGSRSCASPAEILQ